jgi:hypothetical protein
MTPFNKQAIMIALLAVSAFSPTVSGQSNSNTDPLKPYTTCKLSGGLQVREVTRRPKSLEKYREVTTAKGSERVSVVDGYRVMFSYKDVRYYYANVKIEQSDPASYVQDKERIINSLKHVASSKNNTNVIYAYKMILNGFEHYGTDRDVIDIGGTIGTHVLYLDSDNLIVTIYFLNQDDKTTGSLLWGGKRRFNNIEEYRTLRDEFLSRYSECLKRVADAKP